MREIKFRAWFNGQMYDDAYINKYTLRHWTDSIKCPVMQYTGLKDKNGKDIYEGDIVHCSIEGDNIGNVDVIQFKDASFWLRYRDRSIPSWIEFGNELEVMGNIHENLYLLNQGV